jgi:hypothetical protein
MGFNKIQVKNAYKVIFFYIVVIMQQPPKGAEQNVNKQAGGTMEQNVNKCILFVLYIY